MDNVLPKSSQRRKNVVFLGGIFIVAFVLGIFVKSFLSPYSSDISSNLPTNKAFEDIAKLSPSARDQYIADLEESQKYVDAQLETAITQIQRDEEISLGETDTIGDQEVAGLSTSATQFAQQLAAIAAQNAAKEAEFQRLAAIAAQNRAREAYLKEQAAAQQAALAQAAAQQAAQKAAENQALRQSSAGDAQAPSQFAADQAAVKAQQAAKDAWTKAHSETLLAKLAADAAKASADIVSKDADEARGKANTNYNSAQQDADTARGKANTQATYTTRAQQDADTARGKANASPTNTSLAADLTRALAAAKEAKDNLTKLYAEATKADLAAKEAKNAKIKADTNATNASLAAKNAKSNSDAATIRASEAAAKASGSSGSNTTVFIPSANADLVITNFVLTDQNGTTKTQFLPTDTIYVKYTIKNQGTDTAKNQYTNAGIIWSQIYGNKPTTVETNKATDVGMWVKNGNNITPGKSTTFTSYAGGESAFPGSKAFKMTKPGSYTARVFVNYDRLAKERDYANNQATVKYTITTPKDPSDLTVTNLKLADANGISKSSFKVNEDIYIIVTSKNVGPDAYTSSGRILSAFYSNMTTAAKNRQTSDVGITLNNGLFSKNYEKTYGSYPTHENSLAFRSTKSFKMTKPGEYTGRLFINSDNAALETNYTNNQTTVRYTITP